MLEAQQAARCGIPCFKFAQGSCACEGVGAGIAATAAAFDFEEFEIRLAVRYGCLLQHDPHKVWWIDKMFS